MDLRCVGVQDSLFAFSVTLCSPCEYVFTDCLYERRRFRYGDMDLPPTPVSMTFSESDEETETELVYKRIQSTLQTLIEEAQWAVATHNSSKSVAGGRVLTDRQRLMMGQYDRASIVARTSSPTPPPYVSHSSYRNRSRSDSKTYSPTPMSEHKNRRSWPMAAPTSSRLLRMATQPGSSCTSTSIGIHRPRSQSMPMRNMGI
ncbi:hypothetical protein BX666DRAFT_1493886 [Dichotomocladium elegans]|nr:hypothetical protein BX666DRAFT_1493886 [Dichotomocladium elegans]